MCECCDNIVRLPLYRRGFKTCCPRCGSVLRQGFISPMQSVGAVAMAALMMLFGCIAEPFMSIEAMGITASMSLLTILTVLKFDWSILLYIFGVVTFLCPVLVLGIITAVGIFKWKLAAFWCRIYSWSHRFCMVDVFVLGIAVSLVKLTSLANVAFHDGFYIASVFSALLIWCCIKVRPLRLWDLYKEPDLNYAVPGVTARKQGIMVCRECGMPFKVKEGDSESLCPRCGAKVRFRKHFWVQKTTALLIAALIMYLPANLYPIMFTSYLGTDTGSNIIDGVIAMWDMGSWFVAAVILIASIFIPMFKILMLFYLLWEVKTVRRTSSRVLSVIYRLVEFIGKWSMIDVFVVIIMSAIVRISGLLTIAPGFAVVYFCMVVLITIFAAASFDERLIWDRFYE